MLFCCSPRPSHRLSKKVKPREGIPTRRPGCCHAESRYRVGCTATPSFSYNSGTMIEEEYMVLRLSG